MIIRLVLLAVAMWSAPGIAANTPCSGKKGGISHCMGQFFICRDGTTSQSKKDCRSAGGVSDQRPAQGTKEKRKRK